MSWEPSDDEFEGGESAAWEDARDRAMAQDEDEGHEHHGGDGEEDDDDEDDPDYRDEPDEDDEFHGNSFPFALRDFESSWLFIDY